MNSFKFLTFLLFVLLFTASCDNEDSSFSIVNLSNVQGSWDMDEYVVEGNVVDETPSGTTTSTFTEQGSNIQYLLELSDDLTHDATGEYDINGTSTAADGTTADYSFENVNFFLANGTYTLVNDQLTFLEQGAQPITFTVELTDDNRMLINGTEVQVLTQGSNTTTTTRTYSCGFTKQ